MRFSAPQVAKLVDNTATDEDMAQLHIASLPKDLPADIRQSGRYIARAFSYELPSSPPENATGPQMS